MGDNFKGRLRMAVVLFAVVAGFYWKLTLTRQFDWTWVPDVATQVLPWFEEQARYWGKGTIALWDPSMWGGQPLLGQAQPGAAYPLNWILFALPLHKGFLRSDALAWYFVVERLMAVAFCYWLCRDLGRSRTASLLGGCVFGLAGYIGTTNWPQMVNGALWLPLVFLFLLRAVRTPNTLGNAALSGMFLGIAWLSGHHQAPLFILLAAAGTWIYFILRSGRWDWLLARAAAVSLLFMALTGALQILPAYEYGHLAKRWVNAAEPIAWKEPVPYTVHEKYDLKPYDLPGLVFPYIATNASPFVGIAALSLAILGLAVSWRDRRVRLLAAVGIGGLVYALGHFSVFQGLLYGLVPELDKARVASAAVFLFQFGVAVLAAFGMDQLGSSEPSPWPRRVMATLLVFAMVSLGIFLAAIFIFRTVALGPDSTMLVPFLALGVAALIYAFRRGTLSRTATGVLMVLLVLLDLGNDTAGVIASRTDKSRSQWLDQMRANQDMAEFLQKQPGHVRTMVADDAFAENWGEWHGVEMWRGYLASLSSNIQRVESWKYGPRMLFGVAYTIAGTAQDGGKEVFTGRSGMKIYQYADAFPRVWSVHTLRRVRDAEEGNRMIDDHLAEFHNTASLMERPPAVETCESPDQVELAAYSPNRVQVKTKMACKGMVVLSDVFFPGWHAAIDGQSAPIYEVNQAMRGVVVQAGIHTLTFQYRPVSVIIGLLLTLCGIGGAAGLAWREARKSFDPMGELRQADTASTI